MCFVDDEFRMAMIGIILGCYINGEQSPKQPAQTRVNQQHQAETKPTREETHADNPHNHGCGETEVYVEAIADTFPFAMHDWSPGHCAPKYK